MLREAPGGESHDIVDVLPAAEDDDGSLQPDEMFNSNRIVHRYRHHSPQRLFYEVAVHVRGIIPGVETASEPPRRGRGGI